MDRNPYASPHSAEARPLRGHPVHRYPISAVASTVMSSASFGAIVAVTVLEYSEGRTTVLHAGMLAVMIVIVARGAAELVRGLRGELR